MISCFSFNMIKLLLFSDKVRAKYKIFSAVPGTFRVWQFFLYFFTYNLNSALNYNEEGTGTFILNALKIAL